jgi:hypothetical protein
MASPAELHARWQELRESNPIAAAIYFSQHRDEIAPVAYRDAAPTPPERDPAIVQREREADAAMLVEYRAARASNPVLAAHLYNEFGLAIRRAQQTETAAAESSEGSTK